MAPLAERVETTSTSYDRSEMVVGAGLNIFELTPDLIGVRLERTKYLPEQLIERYLTEALKSTSVRTLEDGTWFAEVPGFAGVWAADADLAKCASELRDALYDWLVIKIEHNDRDIPVVAGIRLNSI